MPKQKTYRNENDVKNAAKRLLSSHGWFYWSNGASAYGSHGKSDIMALKQTTKGRVFMAIEAKFGGNKLSGAQQKFLKDITSHGGIGITINDRNLDRFRALLEILG